MEKAGHRPHLANPTEAKKRMGKTNKTDALDAKGLAILLHNGTLPESWIPPGELRDRRELLRTRMALRDLRTSLKHRIHAAIDRYGLQATSISDLFGVKGRVYIDATLDRLPRDTAAMIQVQLTSLDQLEVQIEEIENRIAATLKPSPEVRLKAYRDCHVGLLYHRLAPNKGHGRAIVAAARHLAEASYWVLRKQQPYKSPAPRSNQGPNAIEAA